MKPEVNDHVNILGVRINAVNLDRTLDVVEGWISKGKRNYVCARDVHGVVRSQRDDLLRRIHNKAGLVIPDGMPLVWLARVAGFGKVGRVRGSDLMLALCERSVSAGYRHFFYGGGPGIPERLASNLQQRFPGLKVAGMYSPPFRPLTSAEEDTTLSAINATRADIVWVGLGTPKQEKWMASHVHRLNVVLIGVGAAFDFHAGTKKQAPGWVQHSGFEWLFRLLTEPRRLWRRYCAVVPLFLIYALMQATRLRKYSLDE